MLLPKMPATCHEQSSAPGDRLPSLARWLFLEWNLWSGNLFAWQGAKVIILFVFFVKITEYDEPWVFKPRASGLAGFPFAFVCLGGASPPLPFSESERETRICRML